MTSFLVIKNIKAHRASMFQTSWCISPAPIMPSFLFVEALRYEIFKKTKIDISPSGIQIIHHYSSPFIETFKNKGQNLKRLIMIKGAHLFGYKNKKSVSQISMQPEALCDYCISIVIKCEIDSDILNKSFLNEIKNKIFKMRFAGGNIENHPAFHITTMDQLESSLKYINSGYLVTDAGHIFENNLNIEDLDPVEAFLLSTQRINKETSWIVPANLGYSILTDFEERKGAREDPFHHEPVLHAFAEPMIGLVQFKSLKNIISLIDKKNHGKEDDFWNMEIENDEVVQDEIDFKINYWTSRWDRDCFLISAVD